MGPLKLISLSSLSWSDGSTLGLSLRSSDHVVGRPLTLLRTGQSRLLLDDDVPTPRLGRGVEPVTGGTVSDDSHPSLRCEPTMTIQRTFTQYVSGYGESAVSTLSASVTVPTELLAATLVAMDRMRTCEQIALRTLCLHHVHADARKNM